MTREEAIEVVKERLDYYEREKRLKKACEILIPELAESEDERIRKHLIEIVEIYWGTTNEPGKAADLAWLEKQKENPDRLVLIGKAKSEKQVVLLAESNGDENIYWDTKSEEDAVSLLEKGLKFFGMQKPSDLSEMMVHKEPYIAPVSTPMVADEQKSAEWSEEDEDMRDKIISDLEWERRNTTVDKDIRHYDEELHWLKSLKPQSHSEWRHYIWAINMRFDFTALIKYDNTDDYEIVQAGNRPKQEKNGIYIPIKDIKHQFHWKPSKEQMEALERTIHLANFGLEVDRKKALESLYEQIKKL